MVELICAIIFAIMALVCLIISILQFREKGFVFDNTYIWASREKREAMAKKSLYRRAGIAFAVASAVLLVMALEFVLMTTWLWLVVGALSAVLLVYAIAISRNEM